MGSSKYVVVNHRPKGANGQIPFLQLVSVMEGEEGTNDSSR